MPKLTKKAIRYGQTDGRRDVLTDPYYRKALLLKNEPGTGIGYLHQYLYTADHILIY